MNEEEKKVEGEKRVNGEKRRKGEQSFEEMEKFFPNHEKNHDPVKKLKRLLRILTFSKRILI